MPAVTMVEDTDRIVQFCRECNVHGHNLKDCSTYYERRAREDDRSSRRIRLQSRPRSRGSTRSDRKELIRGNNRDDSQREKQKVLSSQTEIELKIAQQREELLRRERVREMIEPLEGSWNAPTPTIQPYFPSILPYGSSNVLGSMSVGVPPLGLSGPVPPIMDSVLLEQQLRAAQEEEIRKKKDEDDKRLKEKEEELKKKMELELEEKRRQMEEEIRKQVQQEERARLQIELSKQQSYVNFPSGFVGAPSTSNVALGNGTFSGSSGLSGYSTGYGICATVDYEMEEIKRLVKETEEKLIVLQRNAQESTLSAIFQSRAFQTVAALGENANMLDQRQKQELLRELKALLSEAVPENNRRHRKNIRDRQRDSIGRNFDRNHEGDRSRDHVKRRSRSRSRDRRRSNDRKEKGNDYKEIRVQIGGITLRNLTPIEQRRLVSGDVVVAQDMKTGKWTTARITKVSGDRAILTIGGNTTWKKNLNDLYKELPKGTM
uniref:CCHC-type domain-containing protein n=1 Tax=Heterorhabditis bacteriophora TaxID=37862 RepID=A0A1I7XI03_HETBA